MHTETKTGLTYTHTCMHLVNTLYHYTPSKHNAVDAGVRMKVFFL